MATEISKKQLEKKVQEVFDNHKDATEVYATTDGNVFLKHAKSLAADHARKHGLKCLHIQREDRIRKTEDGSKNAEKAAGGKPEGNNNPDGKTGDTPPDAKTGKSPEHREEGKKQ